MLKVLRPLLLFPDLWQEFGLNESIVLAQLDYWIEHNRANETGCFEGRYWTYNSIKAWREQFPGWSEDTIRRVLANLEKDGLVLSGNFNKYAYDRTKWYTIRYENPRLAPFTQIAQMDDCNLPKPIPETSRDKRVPAKKARGKVVNMGRETHGPAGERLPGEAERFKVEGE